MEYRDVCCLLSLLLLPLGSSREDKREDVLSKDVLVTMQHHSHATSAALTITYRLVSICDAAI